jgi:hypothetical protein
VWTEGGQDQWFEARCTGIVDVDGVAQHQLFYVVDDSTEDVAFGNEVCTVQLFIETPRPSPTTPHSPRPLPAVHACTTPPPPPPPPLAGQAAPVVWRSQAEHERVLKGDKGARSGNKRKGSKADQGAAAGRAKKQRTARTGQVGGNPANRNTDRGLAPLCRNPECTAAGGKRGNCGNDGWDTTTGGEKKPAWKPLCSGCAKRRKQSPELFACTLLPKGH